MPHRRPLNHLPHPPSAASLPSSLAPLPPLPQPPDHLVRLLLLRHQHHTQHGENEWMDETDEHLQAGVRVGRLGEREGYEDEDGWEDDEEPLVDLGEASQRRKKDVKRAAVKPEHLVVLSKHPGLLVTVRGTFVLLRLMLCQRCVSSLSSLQPLKRHALTGGGDDVQRMPGGTRFAMRLLYHGPSGRYLNNRHVEEFFKKWSEEEGRKYNDPHHAQSRIRSFIRAYDIPLGELALPSPRSYPTLNAFFSRRLSPSARPIASPSDTAVISSAADCRLSVFESVGEAKRLWVKGKHFTLSTLLSSALDPSSPPTSSPPRLLADTLKDGSVAIFRLAPADYHRFHAPVPCVVRETVEVPGSYYTVNSMIVRDKRFDVFTENKRDVTALLTLNPYTSSPVPLAYIQLGALLVASIIRTVSPNQQVARGEELGYFEYGGSTVVLVFPKGTVQWDEDLRRNSRGENEGGVGVETLVRVGEQIGRWVNPNA
ncbi:hypothetical protein JCM8547_008472 [Rhodosporidiobolus lusitaniae]